MNETRRYRVFQSSVIWTSFTVYLLHLMCGHWLVAAASQNQEVSLDCKDLQMGQYYCLEPEIDNETQAARGCSEHTRTVEVPCLPHSGINCSREEHTGDTIGFYKHVPCKYTKGTKFSVAVLLSVFLGMFGVDRFYLGYPAIGLLKLCTLGFMFLGQLIDVILIALQVVGPSDGSDYVIDYYGPVLYRIDSNNFTYVKPQYNSEYNVEL